MERRYYHFLDAKAQRIPTQNQGPFRKELWKRYSTLSCDHREISRRHWYSTRNGSRGGWPKKISTRQYKESGEKNLGQCLQSEHGCQGGQLYLKKIQEWQWYGHDRSTHQLSSELRTKLKDPREWKLKEHSLSNMRILAVPDNKSLD